MINSLYGKQLMKPIMTTTAIVSTVKEFNAFCSKYDLSNFQLISNKSMMVTGEMQESEREERINKPVQEGAFILSYTRRIMLNFVKACDPTLKSMVFLYTDTDSLHIPAKHYHTLKEKGYIVDKAGAKMGYLCSDIKNEGLIISAKYFSPKCYAYEYIDSEGKTCLKNDATMKTKGIPKACLDYDLFEKGDAAVVKFDGLKRMRANIGAKDKAKGVTAFSIVNATTQRTWNKSTWQGMDKKGDEWFPKGHVASN
jgi:hypothetical protein